MSSHTTTPTVDYKLLQSWDDDEKAAGYMEDEGEEGEEEDLNLHMNGRQSSLRNYMSRLGRYDLESSTRGRSRWPSQGSRRGLMAAAGVGVVLVVLVISAAVLVNRGSSDDSEANQRLVSGKSLKDDSFKNITLPDVLSGTYSAKGFNGSWIPGEDIQYTNGVTGDLEIYSVSTGNVTVLINSTTFTTGIFARPAEVTLSPDRKYALISYDQRRIYRHSVIAKYAIYDFATSTFEKLEADTADQNPAQPDLLQLVEWSPANNGIAFVYENDVYYRPNPMKGTPSIRLTNTGGPQIYNGIADWVYEEEMFSTFRAIWFSPQGGHLAFASFNDTQVRDIQFLLYGEPGQFPRFQYPVVESIPYPKAGTPNPVAAMTIVNLADTNQKIKANINSYYIGTAVWATDNELMVVTMNRPQNHVEYLLCDNKGICNNIHTIEVPNGWYDINTPKVSADGNKFLVWKSIKEDNETHRHIVQIDRTGKEVQVTSGRFAIDSISGWDEANNRVYFTAPFYNESTKRADPSETHLYSVAISDSPQSAKCITCGIKNMESDSLCRQNSADLSSNFKSFIHQCSGPGVPEVHIRSLETTDILFTWVDNHELKKKLQGVRLPVIQDYDVPLPSGFIAKARLWLPPNYEKGQKYPLLVDVYGGPGSQKVSQRFLVDWGTSLVTSHNIIYASIDGRGSGRQSDELMFQIYRKLGSVEIEDQIAAAKWLIANNVDDVIDGNRTAIWGWSYGGYATAMVMGTDVQNIYKCGISVAPVTSWVFYDTIYTERYMGLPTPEDNLVGYNASDVTNHLENFRSKKYYLIHGNADDNVHYQQSMILSRALERADILFRAQSYPDENHGIGSVRRHLYHSLENFLLKECFSS